VQGVVLLACLWPSLEEDVLRRQLGELRRTDWERGRQAYGELLCFGALRYGKDGWARDELFEAIARPESEGGDGQRVWLGIAFSAGNLWQDPGTRVDANKVLLGLAPKSDGDVADAIMQVFLLSDHLPADDQTRALLNAVASCPRLLEGRWVDRLIEHLAELLPNEVELVHRICGQVVEARGAEIGSLRYSLGLSAGHLVNISLTLQRLGGEFRAKGLELFEKLLVLGIGEAQSAINELDIRPLNVPRPVVRRRKGRRRSGHKRQ
jgi:hypothetical protein